MVCSLLWVIIGEWNVGMATCNSLHMRSEAEKQQQAQHENIKHCYTLNPRLCPKVHIFSTRNPKLYTLNLALSPPKAPRHKPSMISALRESASRTCVGFGSTCDPMVQVRGKFLRSGSLLRALCCGSCGLGSSLTSELLALQLPLGVLNDGFQYWTLK